MFVHSIMNRSLVLVLDEAPCSLEVGRHHFLDQAVEVDLALPAQNLLGFCGVSEKKPVKRSFDKLSVVCQEDEDLLDLGRTVVVGIDLDDGLASFDVDTLLGIALAPPSTSSL